MEKLAVLNKMPHDWLQQQVDSNFSLEGIPYAGLMSSLATFQDDIVICDTGTNFYWTNHLCIFMDISFLVLIHYLLCLIHMFVKLLRGF